MAISNPFEERSPFKALEHARRKRLAADATTVVIGSSIAAMVVYSVMWIIQPSWQGILSVGMTIFSVLMCLIVRRLAHRDQVELASYILLITLLLVIGLVALVVEGLSAVIAPCYAAIIVMAGLLLGPVGSFVIAFLAFVLWVGALLVEQLGILPPTPLPGFLPSAVLAAITGLALVFCALMSQLATQDLRRALDDATYELVQTNRKLNDANRMKSWFLARTSHELRTPLNAIIGYTDLTLRRVYGSLTAMQEDGLKRVLSNAKRLQSLINDILDLSKIEAGEMELVAIPFEVKSLIDSVETAVGETARKKGLEFVTVLAPDLPEKIIGDEIRTAQIVLNLADNAVKFTVEGQVSVSITLASDTHWQIQVRDTGRGIREEDFERIFEEFQQIDGPVTDMQPRGTGLGLAITRHLVHRMGGEIKVGSELGKGSTFTVILPLSVEEKTQTQL